MKQFEKIDVGLLKKYSGQGPRYTSYPTAPLFSKAFGPKEYQEEILITNAAGDNADLSIGGVRVSHPISEVSDLWFGQFMLLWRPPAGVPIALTQGSRGAEVVWLRKSLAEVDARYGTTNIDSDEYDANLQAIVRQFQKDYRLDVDGLAGQQTLIVISSLLPADGSPRLLRP